MNIKENNENRVVDENVGSEKVVVVKPNVVLTILACGCYFMMGFFAAFYTPANDIASIIGLLLMFVGVFGLLWTFTYEIKLDDMGITEKRLGAIINFVSWDEITQVRYQKGENMSRSEAWYTGFYFYWNDSSKEYHPYDSMYIFAKLQGKTFSKSVWSARSIFIKKLQRNYIKALKFSVKKLLPKTFMVEARKNLKKMGIDIEVRIKNKN